jgi:hypothetical protein
MHDVLLSLVAAFMPAAWMPYSKQLLAVDALRAQVDRCQHCWQPMCEDSTDRPVRMLQPCGHAIHVDCARARARRLREHMCPRCNAWSNMGDRYDDPSPLHVMPASFWRHPSLKAEITVYPVARRGVTFTIVLRSNDMSSSRFKTRGAFYTGVVLPFIRPVVRPVARVKALFYLHDHGPHQYTRCGSYYGHRWRRRRRPSPGNAWFEVDINL